MLARAIRQAFEEAGDAWIDEEVFIYEAPDPRRWSSTGPARRANSLFGYLY
jgi:hypothetical protein